MSQIAIFPGSFDPITHGHVNLIQRALRLFDQVIIAVAVNIAKKSLLSAQERISLIEKIFKDDKGRISVKICSGLVIHFAKAHQAKILIRGLRVSGDYDHELQLAGMNYCLDSEIETVWLPAKPELVCISSTIVREIISLDGDISAFVPQEVMDYLDKNKRKII